MKNAICRSVLAAVLALPVAACGPKTPPPQASSAAATDPGQPQRLPAGTIGKGSLANKKLIRDAGLGVVGGCGTMGLGVPKSIERYVVQNPVGPRGACHWREKWIVMDDQGRFGAIDFRFTEDGRGGAYWEVENASRLPGPDVVQEPEATTEKDPADTDGAATDPDVDDGTDRCIAVAKQFADCARKGDLDGMVALTSPGTIASNGGATLLKQGYRRSCVPLFTKGNVAWGEPHRVVTEHGGKHIVELPGSTEGEEASRLFMWMAQEGGTYVVLFVSKKPYAEAREEWKQRGPRGGNAARP